MIYLWTFLFLAFATGFVNSHICLSPSVHQDEFRKQVSLQILTLLKLDLSSVKIGGLQLPLLPQILNIAIIKAEVTTCAFGSRNNQFYLDTNVALTVRSSLGVNVKANLHVYGELKLSLGNGCFQYNVIKGSLKVELTLSSGGVSTGLLSSATSLLNGIVSLVTGCAAEIVDSACDGVNSVLVSFTEIFTIGQSPCHYELTDVEIVDDMMSCGSCSYIGGNKDCSTSDATETPSKTKKMGFMISNNNLVWSVEAATKSFVSKILISATDLVGRINVGAYGSGLSTIITSAILPGCTFLEGGKAQINMQLAIEISSLEKSIVRGVTNVVLNLQTIATGALWGLSPIANPTIIKNIEVTYTDENCNCNDDIENWFPGWAQPHIDSCIEHICGTLSSCGQLPNVGTWGPISFSPATNGIWAYC